MARRVRGQEPELRGSANTVEAGASAHYDDPEYYDFAYRNRRDDVAYYLRLARLSRGPVLEYGVGTGRIAVELCRAGIDVTGVDASRPMLEGLERRFDRESEAVQRRIKTVRGDMRSVRLRSRFPLVIATFNTILHLPDREDFERFLSGVRHHLAPGGRFVFDFSVPHADYLGADPLRTYGAPRFRHPSRGLVRYRERFEYDSFRQMLSMELHFLPEDGSEPWMVPLSHRQLFPREIEALLHYNGFSDIVWSADFTDAVPESGADCLVVSCRSGTPARRGRRTRGAAAVRPRQARRSRVR